MSFPRSACFLILLAGCAHQAAVVPGAGETNAPGGHARTLLAVFAHPDDETLVAPVLSRYAREGAHVVLVIATDGRRGAADWTGVPAGDSLATVRASEARCSARALGIEPPI